MATSNNIIRPTAFLNTVARVHLSHLFRDPFAAAASVIYRTEARGLGQHRSGDKGQRTFQCLDCERPDPVKSEAVIPRAKAAGVRPPRLAASFNFQLPGLPSLVRWIPFPT
jgi:hypothetical protein